MQRDMDLIRQLLFRMEHHSGGFAPQDYAVEGYTADQVGYHIWLLGQAGLMKVVDVTSQASSGPVAIPTNLTWEGHGKGTISLLALAATPLGRTLWKKPRVWGAL
jgi:hypothetical protein